MAIEWRSVRQKKRATHTHTRCIALAVWLARHAIKFSSKVVTCCALKLTVYSYRKQHALHEGNGSWRYNIFMTTYIAIYFKNMHLKSNDLMYSIISYSSYIVYNTSSVLVQEKMTNREGSTRRRRRRRMGCRRCTHPQCSSLESRPANSPLNVDYLDCWSLNFLIGNCSPVGVCV